MLAKRPIVGVRDKLEGRRHEIARVAGGQCCRIGRLPHHVDPRAQLPFAVELGELIVASAEVQGHRGNDFPLVLQIIAVEPSGLAARNRRS